MRGAARPKHVRDTDPDLKFLTVEELQVVLWAIPDDVVVRALKPFRAGRAGPSPPPPADVLRPVLRVLVLTAAMTGLRQGELLGLRWRDIDWSIQRVRGRQTWRRTESPDAGSPTCRRGGRCRWRTRSSPRWMRGRGARSSPATTTCSSPTRSSAGPWTARRSPGSSSRRVATLACASCASTTCATRARPGWRPAGCRCGRSSRSLATPSETTEIDAPYAQGGGVGGGGISTLVAEEPRYRGRMSAKEPSRLHNHGRVTKIAF